MTVEDMIRLISRDRHAGRLMAFFMAQVEEFGEVRALLARAALGFSEAEWERCIAVLEAEGFGRVVWRN